jgi:PEP-CTERM motif
VNKRSAIALVCTTLGLSVGTSAGALQTETFSLDQISSPTIGTGTLGTVTLTEILSGPTAGREIDVSVSLLPGVGFVSTGGPHNAFAFNFDDLAHAAVTITSPLDTFALVHGSVTNTPYGSFLAGIDCTGCGNGGSHPVSGPLTFSVVDSHAISFSDFTANSGGYFFSADLMGPAHGTGNVAAIPEPSTYALVLCGLGALALTARTRRRRDPAMAFAI